MPWQVQGPACSTRVPKKGGGWSEGYLSIVSTTTIDTDIGGVQTWRMFGDFEKLVNPILTSVGLIAANEVQELVLGKGYGEGAFAFIAYLDTPAGGTGTGSTPFDLDASTSPPAPLQATEVPSKKLVEDWTVQYIDSYSAFDPLTGGGTNQGRGIDLEVVYAAPHVVQTPDGRWLMILNRLRSLWSTGRVFGPGLEYEPWVTEGPPIGVWEQWGYDPTRDWQARTWRYLEGEPVVDQWLRTSRQAAPAQRHERQVGRNAEPGLGAERSEWWGDRLAAGTGQLPFAAGHGGTELWCLPMGLGADCSPGAVANSLGDIVAWCCDDPTFTGETLVGPILLVDGLAALPEAKFRPWVGVAGGAFVDAGGSDWSMYLYYAAEFPSPYVEHERAGYDAAFTDYVDGHLRRWTYAMFSRDEIDAQYGGRPCAIVADTGGIAVKRIAWSDLRHALHAAAGGSSTPEESWTLSDAVDGELLGMVWTWVAEGSGLIVPRQARGFVRRFTHAEVAKTTDPCPVAMDEGSVLSLVFSALPSPAQIGDPNASHVDGKNGHGIWRAAAIPSGRYLRYDHDTTSGFRKTVFGVDMVVADMDSAANSADLVARAVSSQELKAQSTDMLTAWPDLDAVGIVDCSAYADPDAFVRSDGRSCVLTVGASFSLDPDNNPTPAVLVWSDGEGADLSRSWTDAGT